MTTHISIPWPKEIKKTKQRLQIWDILQEASHPLNAFQIGLAMGEENPLWKSTVYRTLDLLVEKGYVNKTAMTESGMTLYELKRQGHRHYAICTVCHTMIPLKDCPLQESEALTGGNFHVTGHNIEIYGLCDTCYRLKEQGKGNQ